MKKSIFKGHLIEDEKLIYESAYSGPKYFLETLNKYGISDWEQIYSLLNIDSIQESLKDVLQVKSSEDIEILKSSCESVLTSETIKNLKQKIEPSDQPLGARKPDYEKYEINENFRFTEGHLNLDIVLIDHNPKFIELASSINHIQELNLILSQGDRGTCSSFAVTVANEFAFFKENLKKVKLSEQHLFYESKLLENDEICGSWIVNAMKVISHMGQCTENCWSYNPNLPCIQLEGCPDNAAEIAFEYKRTFFGINPNSIDALRQVLSSGRIIPFSIPVFNSWYESQEVSRTGRITMPFLNESEISGHSMVLVGYQNMEHYPGGGYFIIRNSWGRDWGRDNYYGQGYGIIPYAYITSYAWETYAFY